MTKIAGEIRRMHLSGPVAIVLSAAAMFVAGCPQHCPDPSTIVPVEQLILEYDYNAAAVPRLWAKVNLDIKTKDLPFPISLEKATLILNKANDRLRTPDFALIGRQGGKDVFSLGASRAEDVYYFWTLASEGCTAFYGQLQLAGAPGTEQIPLDPTQLLATLAICELPLNTQRLPLVALTMDETPGQCAYVLSYLDRQPLTGRIAFRREVYFTWDGSDVRRPYMVKFIDAKGRRVMTATLDNYKSINLSDDDYSGKTKPPAPLMPTDIKITWPDKGAWIRLRLSQMTTEDKVSADAFLFRANMPPGGGRMIQVDRGLRPGPVNGAEGNDRP